MSSALDSLPEGYTFKGQSSSSVTPEINEESNGLSNSLPEGYTFKGQTIQQQQQQPQDIVPQPATIETLEKGTYTENDLKDDKYYGIVSEYMKDRYNVEESEEYNREEITTMFMNNMRGFAGGNTVRALSEVAYLNGLDENQMAKTGEAYTLFEGMANLYSDETTLGEAAGGTWDYVRSALADPVNLVSLGIGKVFASGGTKVGVKAAQVMAKEAMKRQLAKGATVEVAKEFGEKVFARQAGRISIEAGKRLAQREGKSTARRAVIGTVAVDTVQAIGTAYAYEKSMVRTGVQDDINAASLGLAALGTVVLGGAVGAATIGRSSKDFLGTETLALATNVNRQPLESMTDMFGFNFVEGEEVIKRSTKLNPETGMEEAIPARVIGFEKGKVKVQLEDGSEQLLRRADLRLADNTATGGNEGRIAGSEGWQEAVSRGYAVKLQEKERLARATRDPNFVGPVEPEKVLLNELDEKFFTTLLLGNKDLRVRGIMEAMAEQGYHYQPRDRYDTISRFVTDALKSTKSHDIAGDKNVATVFLKEFMEATGIRQINLGGATGIKGRADRIENINIDNFADYLSFKTNQSGVLLNAWSQTRRVLGKTDDDFADTTYDEYLRVALNLEKTLTKPEELTGVAKFLDTYVNEGIRANQNRVIRLLVSNPSTSALNLVGWGAATGINSVADIGVGLSQLPVAAMYKVLGKEDKATDALREASSLFMANKQRLKNLLDPQMTYDAFEALGNKNPALLKELRETLSGGVDASKITSFDPKKSMFGAKLDQSVDFIQTLTFVKAQDAFTKSQEFTYQLDKNLRKDFGKSWSKFFTDDNADVAMGTKTFKDAVSKAVVETQKATFSKSYADVGLTPKFIEEMRNIPGVGLLVPFGRFFNNTINFMVESSGGAMILKKATGKAYAGKSQKELAMRAAIGWGTVYAFTDNEKFNREEGLAWDQYRDKFGAVTTLKYDFPLSHLKAGSSIMSYLLEGQQPPPDMLKDISDQLGLGSITRQLNQTVDGLGSTMMSALSGEEGAMKELSKIGSKMGSQVISGVTRAVDPINQIVGLARGSDGIAIDRRQNSRFWNDSLRYMDQMIGAVSGDLAPQRYKAATGKQGQETSKIVGVREVKLTNTSKMMNMIGKASFTADLSINTTGSAEGSNRYAEVFNSFVEFGATKLIKSDLMDEKKYSLLERQDQVKKIMESAKSSTQSFMELGAIESNDSVLFKMIKLATSAGSIKKLDKAVKKMGHFNSFADIADIESTTEALQQLSLIDAFLKAEKYNLKMLPRPQ